jgi:hypothetical protein
MKDKRLTILIAGVVWIAQAFLISIPALGQNNWDPIDPNDAIAGIDVLLGPGYFYNPMDLHVRDGQYVNFQYKGKWFDAELKYDGGNWKTIGCSENSCGIKKWILHTEINFVV